MTSTREIYNSSPDSIFDNTFPTTTTSFDNTFPTTGGVGGVERGGGGEENKSVLSYNSGFTELINERYNNNNTTQQRHSSIVDWPSPPINDNNNSDDVDIYNNYADASNDNNSMRRRDPSPPHTTNQSSKVNLARQIIYKRNNNNNNNSMADATGQAARADTVREEMRRRERGVDPTSISAQSIDANNNSSSSGKKKKKMDPPPSLAVDSFISVNQKQRLPNTTRQYKLSLSNTYQSKQRQPMKQSTQHKSTSTMQRHFQKHNKLPTSSNLPLSSNFPISSNDKSPQSGNSSITGTINTSNSILTDEMNDEELLQRRLRLQSLKQKQSKGGGVRQTTNGVVVKQSNVKPKSVNQHSSMSSSSINKSNVKQSSKKRMVSQKFNNQGSDKMRDQLQKHLGVQSSNKEGRKVATSPSDQGQQGSSSHQARQEEGILQQLYSPLERTTTANKESSRPASANSNKPEDSKSNPNISMSSHPHDGPAPVAIKQRQQRQKSGAIAQSSSSSAVAVVQQQRPPTHPDSSRTTSPPNINDNNNNASLSGMMQSRHHLPKSKGGAYTTTTSQSTNPSPTSVISSSPSTSTSPSNTQQSSLQHRGSVQQSRDGTQLQQHTTTQRTLLSPVRSDHSADLAAGGNFHGSLNFGNVRRRIFDNNSNSSSTGRAGVSSSNGGRGSNNDEGVQIQQRPPLSPLDESSSVNEAEVNRGSIRVQHDPPSSSPNRNTPPTSLASSRSIFRLNPSVLKSKASPPTTDQGQGQGQNQGNGGRSVSGRDSPSLSVDAFDESVQLSPESSYANNNNNVNNISGDSFDRRGNLTIVSWNDDEESEESNNKTEEDCDSNNEGEEYTIPLGEKLSKLHNQPSITSMKRSGLGRSFDSATNQSKVSRFSGKSGIMSYGGGNSIQPSVESECVRQNAEIAIAMGDMMEFFLGVDDEAVVAEDVVMSSADDAPVDMSSSTPQPKQQIPMSFNRHNLPVCNDLKQPSLVSGTSGASTSIFEAFEVAPTNPQGNTTKLPVNDINVQHAYIKKRGSKKRKASLPLVTESATTSKDVGGSTSFDQVITRRVSSEDSEPPLKVSRSFDSSAVASIQPSIDSECVRQNDDIAVQMGDMMQMFMETPEEASADVDLPIDEQVYVEEEIYVDEESYEDQMYNNSGGGLEPLAEDEVYDETESSPGHQVQYNYQDPRSTKTNQYTTLNPGRVVSPSTTMSGSSPGSSHMTPTASNIKVIPQGRLSSHLLMPSTSEEEEYDDPSVFGSTSMMSDSSSEMTPMISRASPVQASQARQPQKQVTNKKNHNSLINKNKNLANFLDSFSDHLLRGCNDNDDDDASTDVFFVNNSQFGKDTSQFNDSQFSSTSSSSGVGINQFDLPKHPLNQALPVNVNNDDKLEEEKEEEVITDQQIAQFQRWKQLNKSNQTTSNDHGLPKPSTFMSAKDRTRIRKHDTTPQRTNTSRAQRGRMSLRRAPSFASEVSMSSIKEDMEEEDDEIVLEPMVVEEASDESSSSSSDDEHVISSESEGSACSSDSSGRGRRNKQVLLDDSREPSVRSEDPPSSQDPPTLSSPTRKSTGGNEININRQLSSDAASRHSSDPPDADDMIKMTNREMRKGSSLAWHTSNGVNDDELYDTNHLPSRANRAATLAGRLNLLSITSNNASFQKYYHDSQKSRAQRRRGVRSLYRSNYEPDIESIQEEEYEASALEEVMDQDDGGSDSEDMIDSWDQGEEEDEVVSECYSHDDFVKDFKEIMAREKAIATAVEAKKQRQSPLTMTSKRMSNNGRDHQKQGRDDKATVATSRRNKGSSGRATKPSLRPPTQSIRRQQSAHPHDIPNELPKSRLEEKLLIMKRADRRHHNVETSSVATSDLGSLISRNSDKSHVIGVPKTIFHRTHPSSRGGSSVVGGRGGSMSSQMSSLQNTPGSTIAPKTHTTVAQLRSRGYSKAIVPSILPPDRNDDADTLDEDNSLLVSLPGKNNDDDDDMKMLGLEGYTKSTQPPTIKRKTAPQIAPTKETYDGVNVLLDAKPRWSPTADLKKIDEELQRTQAQNSKQQKANHVDTTSVEKKNVTALPAAAIQKSNSVDSDVDGNVRSGISIQETPPRVADDQLPKMRIGTETWKLKYDMVDRTSVPPPSSAAPTPTRSNIKSSPLSVKNISPLRKKQASSNKVAKQPTSVRPLETIGTIDNGMNQGRIKIQVTSRTPKQMPPSALRNSAPPAAANPTASSINNNPSLEMKRHNSVPIQRHSSLKDAASLQRIRSLDAQKALSFWKYLNPHDTETSRGVASKAKTNKISRSSPIPPPPPPPGPPPQQRQIPSSFNPPRRVHQPSIVSGTSHSSIFEAFEIAPLHTAHGNTRLELNSFGVHHAYVKRGGSNAKKRVGFPETQQMSRQTRSTPISSSGGIEPPSQSVINTPIPLGGRSRTYECQSSSGNDMVTAPLTSRSRSYDNDVQEFEVMLNNRNLQAPPPPPPPPPSRGSKWVRMGWKKMSSNSTSVRGSVQSSKKKKSLSETQTKGGSGYDSATTANKKWIARTDEFGNVEFAQQVIPSSMYK